MAKKDLSGSTAEFIINRQKKKGLRTWQKILIGIALFFLLIIFIGICVFSYYKHSKPIIDDNSTVSELIVPVKTNGDDEPDVAEKSNIPEYVRKDKTYTFLIVGCDRAQWLTDVIMIATYDVTNKKFAVMQIPRDTYVVVNSKLILDDNGNITHENFDGENDHACKINSVMWHGANLASSELTRIYSLAKKAEASELAKICEDSFLNITPEVLSEYAAATGKAKSNIEYKIKLDFGIKYLTALLARSFGTPIDFYAQLNLNGFVNIVDAIGGVDVYIQHDMDYEDVYQNPPLKIHLKKGNQHLDGAKAEQFIRYRSGYAAADIARIDAQKIFMTAFIKKVVSLEGIVNMDKLIREITSNLTTNIGFDDAGFFLTNAFDLNFNEIVMLTMPGWALYIDGISYYSIDKEAMMQTVNEYLNKYTKPLTEEYFCAIQAGDGVNYTTPPLTATEIQSNQPNLGFMNR